MGHVLGGHNDVFLIDGHNLFSMVPGCRFVWNEHSPLREPPPVLT